MLQDEMIFLGMARKPKTQDELRNGPLQLEEKEVERRKFT
jgi:hypothetical protein